jgi:hypothetical protein
LIGWERMRGFKKSGMVSGVRAKEAANTYDAAMTLLDMGMWFFLTSRLFLPEEQLH